MNRQVLISGLRKQAQTQRQHSDKVVRDKGAYPDDNDHIDAAVLMEQAADFLERTITEAEMAAGDLHSAATCGLSTLRGLDVVEGGRISFIRGMLEKHARYGIKADLSPATPSP